MQGWKKSSSQTAVKTRTRLHGRQAEILTLKVQKAAQESTFHHSHPGPLCTGSSGRMLSCSKDSWREQRGEQRGADRKADLSTVSETSEDGGGLSASVNYQTGRRTSGSREGSSRGRSTAMPLSSSHIVLHGHAQIMFLFPKFYPEKPA